MGGIRSSYGLYFNLYCSLTKEHRAIVESCAGLMDQVPEILFDDEASIARKIRGAITGWEYDE